MGVGVGLDHYAIKTIPLFIGFRTNITSHKETPYVYVDAGVNFLRMNDLQKEQAQFPLASPGVYYDAGLGWKLSGKKHRAVVISAGYTLKQVRYKTRSFSISPVPQPENYDRYNFLYRRFIVKLGFQL